MCHVNSTRKGIAVISDPRPQLPDSDDEFTTTDLLYASRDYDDEDTSDVVRSGKSDLSAKALLRQVMDDPRYAGVPVSRKELEKSWNVGESEGGVVMGVAKWHI